MKLWSVVKQYFQKFLVWLAIRNIHSKEDIAKLIKKTDALKQRDKKLVLLSLYFPEIKLKEVMINRSNITFIKETAHLGPKILDDLYATGQKIFPVAHSSLEDTIGIIYLEDITEVTKGEQTLSQATHLRPPILKQDLSISEILFEMMKQNASLVLIADNDKKIVGMVEINTILKKLFG